MKFVMAVAIAAVTVIFIPLAWGASLTQTMQGGDTLRVTCDGLRLTQVRNDNKTRTLTCEPNATTTSTSTTTTRPTTSTSTSTSTTTTTRPSTGGLALRVSSNRLVDGNNTPLVLRGVNYSGTEYACIQGWGIFDGPNDEASVQAMVSWHVHSVRIPLNEDCWLGINGVPAAYAGANYRNAIVNYVNLLHSHGIYAELALMWGAPGTYKATYQSGGPDADHSPAMWASMAATFANDPAVILAPWGETITDFQCFMKTGCNNQATYGPNNQGYQTAPMQQAVTVMRQNGYHGVVAIPCIDYANNCADSSGSWLQDHPIDADGQLIAEAHIYGNNTCGAQNNGACLTNTIGPLAAQFPVIFGETGETYDDSECTANNTAIILSWADAHNVSWESWTWDTWGTCLSLISDFNGAVNTTSPNGAQYATYVHNHLVAS